MGAEFFEQEIKLAYINFWEMISSMIHFNSTAKGTVLILLTSASYILGNSHISVFGR